jgi:predicted dehydrogenase
MPAVEVALIGAGLRGRFVYSAYAAEHPEQLRIVALAEPDASKREAVARRHDLPPERVFSDWEPLLTRPRLAEAAILATGDTLHVTPALAALDQGYHLLLEKPIAPTFEDCVRVVEAAEQRRRILQIAHVLRYTSFYTRALEVLRSGRLGRVFTLDMKEHVAHWHMVHSFVRGKFRNRELAAPIILAKSCHDLDLLVWLLDDVPLRLSCFGGLDHFCAGNAPPGAPERCTDGCPVQASCVHDAVAFYLGVDDELARSWPWFDVSTDPAREARRRALETGRYGRCVYRCDNDVPDHQVIQFEFPGGTLASFTMQGLGTHETRTIRATGSLGELRGDLREGVLEVTRHGSLEVEKIQVPQSEVGHFGGDQGLLEHFVDAVRRDVPEAVRTSGRASLESHLLGFAAEQSRFGGGVVELEELRRAHGLGARPKTSSWADSPS